MRKLLLLSVFSYLFVIAVQAQEVDSAVASVRYSFTHVMDTTQPENPLKENMVLFLGKNMSNYTSWDRIERAAKAKAAGPNAGAGGQSTSFSNVTSLGTASTVVTVTDSKSAAAADAKMPDMNSIKSISVNGGTVTFTNSSGGITMMNMPLSMANSYYKDQAANKLAFTASAGGKMFAVEEKTPAIEWNITQETKEIQGLQCQKATADFRGRSWEAWFCSSLPYNNGPWKLGGLPGLIVEAYDTKKEVVFTFTSFESANGATVPIEIPSTAVKTTAKEFKQYQEAIQRDREANRGASSGMVGGISAITVSGSMMGPNGQPVKMRMMNNPIEKEIKK